MIWQNIDHLAQVLDAERSLGYTLETRFGPEHGRKIVCTSGGFDPLHVGHLRCIQESRRFGQLLVVIVNGDSFLQRKKGYVFMPLAERMELIDGIAGVIHVVAWDDGSQYVDRALATLRPDFFTKGGDRSSPECLSPAELQICEAIGCRICYGVGGREKIQSSSSLVSSSSRHH